MKYKLQILNMKEENIQWIKVWSLRLNNCQLSLSGHQIRHVLWFLWILNVIILCPADTPTHDAWWIAIVAYIVQHLNTLGQGTNFCLGIFLPVSMAFELLGTNYPHVFLYKSGNKFFSHLSCTWEQEHKCNEFQHRAWVGIDWKITHFSFPYFIWLETLTVVLDNLQPK